MGEVMRFPDAGATLADIADVLGFPVAVVVAFCESHSLPGLSADSVVSQSIAERIARGLEGRA